MKTIIEGVVNYIPSILNEDGTLKDWASQFNSFDNILSHPRFLAYCNNDIDITTSYEMIYMLFSIELNMNKLVGDSKAITDSKWNKSTKDLTAVKDAT